MTSSKSDSTSESRLFCNGLDVAAVTVADTPNKRLRGLLKKDLLQGALILPRTNSVHTIRMLFAIDVAYCSRSGTVVDVVTMSPNRVGRPRLRASFVVEASAGSFEQWGVHPGATLELR